MQDVMAIVKGHVLDKYLPGEDASNLSADTELVRTGILDSLALLDLVSFLEDRFDVEFEAHEVDQTKMNTLQGIETMVRAKLEAA